MFHGKTTSHFIRFCESKVSRYESLNASLKASQAEDEKLKAEEGKSVHHQVYWMEWHSIEWVVAGVAAKEALMCLREIEKSDVVAADPAPEIFHKEAIRNVTSRMRISSRSTSFASNLAEDAKRAFWTEVLEFFNQ